MMTFRTSTLTVKTPGAITLVNGRASQAAPTLSTIQASVQPLTMHQMQSLPEGRRNSKSFTIFTDTNLGMITDKNPPIVTIENEEYEIWKKASWQNGIINHYQ